MQEDLFSGVLEFGGESESRPEGSAVSDPALEEVIASILKKGRGALDRRFGEVFRRSVDEILDGRRTRRYNFNKVSTPEKSYLGAKVEILAREEFDFGQGVDIDFCIAGHGVDAKFSATGEWMIAPKNVGEICLVMQASEETSLFSVGVIRAAPELLRPGSTRDSKRSLHAVGKRSIRWLVRDAKYPRNQLMELYRTDRDAADSIFSIPGGGQQRINELFRRVQRKLINLTTVQTVASQEDSSKRVRDARLELRSEGILILGYHRRHKDIAAALRLSDISQGHWIAVQVHPNEPGNNAPVATVNGIAYRMAVPGDVPVEAPELP
ncbi:NaeI family type II restriction endonuclease [Streptomyces xanthophaeus]|uniref:NaeI family type II restriction endonuclease n=1 Tax=Streptomyces xanthophaeus TaxID=67385 RepID=UPI00371E0919